MESLTSFVGVDGTNPALNSARLQINLKPLDERDDRVQTVISRLQQAVDGVPGVALYLQPTRGPDHRHHGEPHPVSVHPAGKLLEALSTWVPPLLSRLQAQPQLADVSSDWQDKGPAAYIKVDRDSASRLGISMADVDNALYNAFGQRLISTIYTQANHYRVVLEQDTEATPGLGGAGEYPSHQQRRRHRAVDRHRHGGAALYPAVGEPPRSVPGDHHLV